MAECEDTTTSDAIAEARRILLEKLRKVKYRVRRLLVLCFRPTSLRDEGNSPRGEMAWRKLRCSMPLRRTE